MEHPVDAVADAERLLVGLDVNVGGALSDRADEDGVTEPDDRRIARATLEVDQVDVVRVFGDLDLVGVEALHDVVVGDLGRLVGALDRRADGGLRGDDGFDVVPGEEFDVVDGVEVRGIGHRDDERRPGATDGDDLVAIADILGDQLEDLLVDLVLGEVDGLHAVLLAEEVGDLLVGDVAHLRERVAEAHVVAALGGLRRAKLLEADALAPDQEFAESVAHRVRGSLGVRRRGAVALYTEDLSPRAPGVATRRKPRGFGDRLPGRESVPSHLRFGVPARAAR